MALSALAKHDEVLQEMRLVLGSEPQSSVAWRLRAEALVGKGDLVQAVSAIDEVRSLDPTDPKLAEVEAAIRDAHAQGIAGVSVEPTFTKEYPSTHLDEVKWRPAMSATFEPAEEVSLTENDLADKVVPASRLPAHTERELDAYDPATADTPFEDGATAIDEDPSVRPVAGPDEQTLGDPLGTDAPARSRANRPTVEQPREPAPHRFATNAQTKIAPPAQARIAPPAKPTPQRPTPEQFDSWDSLEQTYQRKVEKPKPDTLDRVTREVQSLPPKARPPLPPPVSDTAPASDLAPESDPSIDISANEVVFVPDSSPSIVADLSDADAPSLGQPIEDPSAPDEEVVVTRLRAPSKPISMRPAPSPPAPFVSDAEPTQPPEKPKSRKEKARPKRTPSSSALPFSKTTAAALFAGSVALAVIVGLAIREWKLRVGVGRRYDLAQKKLGTGNFAGYQAAELLYRQILADRDDPRAAVLRAKVLAQLAFEFGEPVEPADHAVKALGASTMIEDDEARTYLALARGELEVAAREAQALAKERPGSQARYLLGQADLLLDHPDEAASVLKLAAAEDSQNPVVLHALGLAEAAQHHPELAVSAFDRALSANPNHVATLIDRALLQLHQSGDRDAASGALEAVVGKLVADASPSQLARAYVGLAEIELAKGNVAAARSALSSAAARRRDHPLLLEELAQAYADAFELDPAEREARRALQVSGRISARLTLAEVALRRSRPLQALTVLEEAGSSRPEVLVLRALAKLELGRNAEARSDAEIAIQLDSSSIPAAVALARVDIAEGHYDAAQRRLEAMETQGKHAEVAWALGQVFLARKMPDRARTFFRSALVRQPLLLEARLALARLLHDAGELKEAREEVDRILAINAAYVPARKELASLALDLGDPVAARDELDAMIERDADVDTLLDASRAHLLLGDARGAEERADRALRLHPSGAELEAAECDKARALLRDHRANEAIQTLLKPVRTAAHGEVVALLIDAYLDYGRVDWAQRAIELAPVAARTGIELSLAKARLALAEGRQQAAKGLIEEAQTRLKSGRSPTWLRAEALALEGQTLVELGQAKTAVKSLRAAVELDPHSAKAQNELGLAYLDLRRMEEATSAFEAATTADPKLAEAQYYLGWSRRSLGDARGDEALKAYVALEPKGALADDARRLLAGGELTQTSDRPRTRPLAQPR